LRLDGYKPAGQRTTATPADGSYWTYSCDALGQVTVTGADPRRLEFLYDAKGRRRSRTLYAWDAQAQTWPLSETRPFVYDLPAVSAPGTQSQALQAGGWNCIFERRVDAAQTVTDAAYVWGLDLSGSMQGAGGVGGLLQASQNVGGALRAAIFYVYDGNGNVTTGTARKGARSDASNVVGNDAPNNLSYAPWARHDWNAISGLRPGLNRAQERSAEDYAADFGSASAEGAHPITYLAVMGYHGVGRTYMFVEDPYQEFNVPEIHSALPAATAHTFEHARDRKGPPRCWFSRKAKAYFVGCNTHYGVSDRFAASFLRKGATAWGTDVLVGVSSNGATFAGEDTEYTKAGDFLGSSHWLPSNGGL
jgi:YD repeat-containing protein